MCQLDLHDPVGERVPAKKLSEYEFSKVILFNRTENEGRPFVIYPRAMFTRDEIREPWLQGNIDIKSRKKLLKPISSLEGKELSLFAKVEKGMYI